MSAAVPVILCGRTPQIARGVIAGLRPEYEVIHMILSPADGKREIPALLRGDAPPTDRKNNLGTQNYSKKAAAVILGGAFGDADIAAMREACRGDSKAPWLRLDLSKPTPPVGPEYGKAMVQRVKSCLKQLEIDGKLDGDSIYFY